MENIEIRMRTTYLAYLRDALNLHTEIHGLPEGKSIKIQFQWLGVVIGSRKCWTEATANCWHVGKTQMMSTW
jgi:hypothetical protein